MIDARSLRPYFCLNNDCSYYLNSGKKPPKKGKEFDRRFTLFKKAGDIIVNRCPSCGTFHSFDAKTNKLEMIDSKPKKAENKDVKDVPEIDINFLLKKLDANQA